MGHYTRFDRIQALRRPLILIASLKKSGFNSILLRTKILTNKNDEFLAVFC